MGMHEYIERKAAERCYKIACDVRDSFTKDIRSQEAYKHSGAAHVAHAIMVQFGLDRPYRGDDDDEEVYND